MAARTSSSSGARSHLHPYDRALTRKSPRARATSESVSPLTPPSESIPPPQSASPLSSPAGTLREAYLASCKRFYPNIQPRHDWDIVVLGCRLYRDSDGDFYAYSDVCLQHNYSRFTDEQVNDGSARAQLMREATELLDKQEIPTGAKPSPGEEDVHIRRIPNSDYSLRIWGKGLESKREYCLDFIRTATHEPVNSPFEHELWMVPCKSRPWFPTVKSRIYSLERSFGIPQNDILPGEEKFVLLEGTACLLIRPGMRSVYFEVPIRSRVDHCLEDVDEITFS